MLNRFRRMESLMALNNNTSDTLWRLWYHWDVFRESPSICSRLLWGSRWHLRQRSLPYNLKSSSWWEYTIPPFFPFTAFPASFHRLFFILSLQSSTILLVWNKTAVFTSMYTVLPIFVLHFFQTLLNQYKLIAIKIWSKAFICFL